MEIVHEEELGRFCEDLQDFHSSLDFSPSIRGWCYLLEEHGLTKGQFGRAQDMINDMRKRGWLAMDICAESNNRPTANLPGGPDDDDADEHGRMLARSLVAVVDRYSPVDFWSGKPTYVEILVEKSDLFEIFRPIAAEYHVPVTSSGGWSDLRTRYDLLRRFRERDDGRTLVLKVCTDHDPGGLQIADFLRSNLEDLAEAAGWHPGRLRIERFGLNADFIEAHRISWIDNLETGSGGDLSSPRHPDHGKDYVQRYLAEHGPRKCEANALITRIDAGRELVREAIEEHVDLDWLDEHDAATAEHRRALRAAMPEILAEVAW